MSKLHRRGYLAISTIAAASALLVVAPAGASAAEEPGNGSTSGETAAEPSGNSTQAAAPAGTEWTPQGGEGGNSGGGDAPLEHGSSVGSGAVTGKAGSDSEKPTYTPESSGTYEPEPEPSIPSTFDEPASTPRAESAVDSVQPTATAARASKPAAVAVGGATSLGRSVSSHGDATSSPPQAVAASFGDSGDRVSTSSYALPLLVIVALGLVLGFAGLRLRRRRRRRQLEALWREQDAAWEAALRRADLGQASGVPDPSALSWQQVNAA
jgi:hypothetical protein